MRDMFSRISGSVSGLYKGDVLVCSGGKDECERKQKLERELETRL